MQLIRLFDVTHKLIPNRFTLNKEIVNAVKSFMNVFLQSKIVSICIKNTIEYYIINKAFIQLR